MTAEVPKRLSVVIPNYNYEQYVGAAIESALSIDWPDVEVIVVDDGSTDGSLRVIEGYRGRLKAVSQANAGQRVACNVGYAASSGEVVMFLDSDDLVDPSIAAEIWGAMRPGVSKFQFAMQRIDHAGQPLGEPFPKLRPCSPEILRYWLLETGAYPTPPGSGNAYTRCFLEDVMPLDDARGDFSDSTLLAAAPVLGDVIMIERPLVFYRRHESNDSALRGQPLRLSRDIKMAIRRHELVESLAAGNAPSLGLRKDALRRGRRLLQLRVAERKVVGVSSLPGDNYLRLLRDSVSSVTSPGPEDIAYRLLSLVWCLAVLASPASVARRLVDRRFQ